MVNIPDYRPPTLNRLLRQHWAVRNRAVKGVYQVVAAYCRLADVPRAMTPRRVSVAVTVAGRGGLPDPDAVLKPLLDGLTRCCKIVDDSSYWLRLGSVTVERGEKTLTAITIEEL